MTQEEKAKAYDELKVKAQELEEDGCFDKITLYDLFPELKESEDERIRKRIIHALHGDVLEMSEIKEAVDWLEKQGEQILANSAKTCKDEQNTVVVIPKFRVGDVIRHKGSTAEYTIESISGECYHGKGWGLHISCDDDYELVEQKPTWKPSESDIKILEQVIGGTVNPIDYHATLYAILEQLKKLKG